MHPEKIKLTPVSNKPASIGNIEATELYKEPRREIFYDISSTGGLSFLGQDDNYFKTPIQQDLIDEHKYKAGKVEPDISYRQTNEDEVIEDRNTLLARKYVMEHNISPEDLARLEILNSRLRILLPPVSEQEIMFAENLQLDLKKIRESTTNILSELKDDLDKS